MVYSRLIHAVEELPHVRAKCFDVTSLAFGVNRLERQTRFATAAGASDDRQFPERKIDIDPFQIVLARPTNLNLIFRDCSFEMFCARDLRTHWKYSLPVNPFANPVADFAARSADRATATGLFVETPDELLALLLQLLRNHAAKRVEKLFVFCEFFLPFLVIDSQKLGDTVVVNIEPIEIEIVRSRQPPD